MKFKSVVKNKAKETSAKAYTPKKVKHSQYKKNYNKEKTTEVDVSEVLFDSYSNTQNVDKTNYNSIKDLINCSHSDIKKLVEGKVKVYIAGSNCLTLVLISKQKVKIEYANQPKTKGKHDNIRFTILDRHNRVIV